MRPQSNTVATNKLHRLYTADAAAEGGEKTLVYRELVYREFIPDTQESTREPCYPLISPSTNLP